MAVGGLAAVDTDQQLLWALSELSSGSNVTVDLRRDVSLSPPAAAPYKLPFTVSPGQNFTIRGGETTMMLLAAAASWSRRRCCLPS